MHSPKSVFAEKCFAEKFFAECSAYRHRPFSGLCEGAAMPKRQVDQHLRILRQVHLERSCVSHDVNARGAGDHHHHPIPPPAELPIQCGNCVCMRMSYITHLSRTHGRISLPPVATHFSQNKTNSFLLMTRLCVRKTVSSRK